MIRGYLALQLLTLARARAIIAVSQYVHERLTPWQGKTTVVPNAVTAVGDARDTAGTGLAFVSNLEPTTAEGLDMVLDALVVLQGDGLAVSLTVIGDGADRPRYEQRAQELGLGQQVRFAGKLVERDRDLLMREAAAVVLYPTTDGAPHRDARGLGTGGGGNRGRAWAVAVIGGRWRNWPPGGAGQPERTRASLARRP